MSIKSITFLISIFCFSTASAQEAGYGPCSYSQPKTYSYGTVSRSQCGTAATGYRESIYLNGRPVLSDAQLFDDDSNNDRSLRVYTSGAANIETGCAPRLYLLDLSKHPVKVLAFGVKNACNIFHWASWGENRSVIALKKNVKFIYENGSMTPPTRGKGLWKSIEGPRTGKGLAEEDAIPFVENVQLPM